MSIGYIYAVELDNGIVKVGRTVNPKARLNKLKYSHKHRHLSEFVSVRCLNFANAEKQSLSKLSHCLAFGKEWFECDFNLAVKTIKEAVINCGHMIEPCSYSVVKKTKKSFKMYTLAEVAEELRMKWSWVDKKVRQGHINIVKMGGTRLVNEKELDRIKEEGVAK